MRLRTPLIAFILLLALAAAACSGDDGDSTTTTTQVGGTTVGGGIDGTTAPSATQPGGGDNGDNGEGGSTTTLAEAAVPQFEIVNREPGEEGDTVVIVLDPESYESLTDIDLQNVIAEVVDEAPPIENAHVVDSPEVAELVLTPRGELTADQQRLLDIHYMARLEDSFRIVYVGPFADTPDSVLGS